uniref:Saposin B-type domain-containing protein n=1 Tax=Ciona savignyi TaxID=51511 RepID=H2Y639_CIOSA
MAKAKQHKITAEMTSKCSACIFLVNYEKMRVKEDPSTIERLGEVVEEGCELFRLESSRICKGAYSIFGAEARSVLTQVDLSAESICGICLPYFCPDIPDSREVKNKSNWSISLPPPSRKLKSNTKLSKMPINVLKVLHLSDIHMDLKYKVGSNADCTEPLCCRTMDGGDKPSIIDPIKGETTKPRILNATQKAWKWGDYRKCDLPWWTVNNLLQQLSRKHTFDYIIWTGD